jgi:adenine-specific DNA-methyltransferase
MKYMGSKRSMLKNGLGKLLRKEAVKYDRFIDLFTGGASVAWYVAENTNKPVLAVDLQKYSTILAAAIVCRPIALVPNELLTSWLEYSEMKRNEDPLWEAASSIQLKKVRNITALVDDARKLCLEESNTGPVWSAYGGHYFSPAQALSIDYLLRNLPTFEPERTLCLAAIISAASECVAAPGHTAQPFQPTKNAGKHILDAWQRDISKYVKKNIIDLASRHAQVKGITFTGDAAAIIPALTSKDLVFIDPPYSSVQYSRFYHVLETIARMENKIKVEGVGRYPIISRRPNSEYSNTTKAEGALKELLRELAQKSCTVICTFPSDKTSNGLSGTKIKEIAKEWFNVEDHSTVEGKFSTLGGNNEIRDARTDSSELIILMRPKKKIPVGRKLLKPK